MSDLGRLDIDGNYQAHATPTGTLLECRLCGALVADRERHDEWHDHEASRVERGIKVLKRRRGDWS